MEKDKMEQFIMVVPRENIEKLLQDNFKDGFWDDPGAWMGSIVKTKSFFKIRNDAEKDEQFKQIIPYCLIINPEKKLIYLYQRSKKNKDYPEKRLQGKFSVGVGGHVTNDNGDGMLGYLLDIICEAKEIDDVDWVMSSLYREIIEEIKIDGEIVSKSEIGYINDDSDSVGKVHLGMVCLIYTDAETASPRDKESVSGKMVPLTELESVLADPKVMVENWTKILMSQIRKLLG